MAVQRPLVLRADGTWGQLVAGDRLVDGAIGSFSIPCTVDTQLVRGTDSTTMTANRSVYLRVREGGTFSTIRLGIATSSGNICAGAFANTYGTAGVMTSAQPGTPYAVTGSIPCPAVGSADISLGSTITIQPGDWLALGVDNSTAAFRAMLQGFTVSTLGVGHSYGRDSTFPIPNSAPTNLFATTGPSIVLIGMT